jgi:ketosteroid isomerase-like protein
MSMKGRIRLDLVRDDDGAGIAAADEAFFGALRSADMGTLEAVLADDFVIVDVMSGRVTGREEFLAAIGSGMLRFAEVTCFSAEQSVRRRDAAGVVVGRTRMVMDFGPDRVTANSRYTHVFVNEDGSWRLMSAQGTPITEQL